MTDADRTLVEDTLKGVLDMLAPRQKEFEQHSLKWEVTLRVFDELSTNSEVGLAIWKDREIIDMDEIAFIDFDGNRYESSTIVRTLGDVVQRATRHGAPP